jgi:hypothetical protein
MTIEEFMDWQKYFQYEPMEEQRADWRSAMIVATLRNIFRGKHVPAVSTKDFLLSFGPKRQQTPEEQERIGYEWYLLYMSQGMQES